MKRTFLALAILSACGDDSASDDTTRDASTSDAAVGSLDAALDASPSVSDARVDAAQTVDAATIDAQTQDTSEPDAAEPGECVAEDAQCSATAACCEGGSCVTSSEHPFTYCAQTCDVPTDCDTGCCTDKLVGGAKVCAPAQYCVEEPDPKRALTGVNCFYPDKPKVFSSNKVFLGDATWNPNTTNGVCSVAGPYSKFNQNGALYITSDAYKLSLSVSATIKCKADDFQVIAYVSRSTAASQTRVIDPDDLCDVLKNSNL